MIGLEKRLNSPAAIRWMPAKLWISGLGARQVLARPPLHALRVQQADATVLAHPQRGRFLGHLLVPMLHQAQDDAALGAHRLIEPGIHDDEAHLLGRQLQPVTDEAVDGLPGDVVLRARPERRVPQAADRPRDGRVRQADARSMRLCRIDARLVGLHPPAGQLVAHPGHDPVDALELVGQRRLVEQARPEGLLGAHALGRRRDELVADAAVALERLVGHVHLARELLRQLVEDDGVLGRRGAGRPPTELGAEARQRHLRGHSREAPLVVDRGNMIHGNLLESCVDVAKLIFKNHGQNCDTYKLAKEFIKDRHNAKNENEIESIENDFEYQLKEEYLSILRKEYEYLTSEEAIKWTIDANEYEFTIDGKIFNQ